MKENWQCQSPEDNESWKRPHHQNNDDKIIECGIQLKLKHSNSHIILLSNDLVMKLKGIIRHIPVTTLRSFCTKNQFGVNCSYELLSLYGSVKLEQLYQIIGANEMTDDAFGDVFRNAVRRRSSVGSPQSLLQNAQVGGPHQDPDPEMKNMFITNMNVDNFVDMYLNGELNSTELLQYGLEYFLGNYKIIFNTVEWKIFLNDYPKFANNLLLELIGQLDD